IVKFAGRRSCSLRRSYSGKLQLDSVRVIDRGSQRSLKRDVCRGYKTSEECNMKVRTELRAGQPSATSIAVGAAAVNLSQIDQDLSIGNVANTGVFAAANQASVSQSASATNSGPVTATSAAA